MLLWTNKSLHGQEVKKRAPISPNHDWSSSTIIISEASFPPQNLDIELLLVALQIVQIRLQGLIFPHMKIQISDNKHPSIFNTSTVNKNVSATGYTSILYHKKNLKQ